MAVEPRRHCFTVAAFHRMGEAGILGPQDRVELVGGEIVEMSPIGSPHAACVARLIRLLAAGVERRAIVQVQNPVKLGERSEPVPDLMLLRPREDFYAGGHPGPADVLLLIEVSDTTLAYDRGVKLPLYAEHGIGEVWLVDVSGATVEVHRDPAGGCYRDAAAQPRGRQLFPLAVPDLAIDVAAILG